MLLALTLLSGCTLNRYEMGQALPDTLATESAQPLSLSQVLSQLGPPLRLASTQSGYVMAWEHWRIREEAVGLSLRGTPLDFLNLDWGQAKVQGSFLLLTFDRQHQLSGQSLYQWDNTVGGGQAVQPFFSFVPVVDVDDLLSSLPQHQWGAMSLDPLPTTLNYYQRVENGQLEQRGTPKRQGQRTLEMH
ncbi:hypothetical protein [Ferrimonas marina]|nr:hypothetical protein [Ferrimonas marina]